MFLSIVTQGSLLITADTVRKGEDRLRSGKECLLIIILGVSCQCQPCGRGETELTEGGGEEEAVGLGVSARHCLSLLLTSQPIHSCSAPKLCAPART